MTLKKMNVIAEEVPADVLRELLEYNPETGTLVWLKRPAAHFPEGKPSPDRRAAMWNGKYAGRPALTSIDPRGYYRGAIGGRSVYAHRVAIALCSGEWPSDEVDHINRDRSDNRLCNLRVVTHSENRKNVDGHEAAAERRLVREMEVAARVLERKRKYPIPGVRRDGAKWAASIKRNGKLRHLGVFACFAEAVAARLEAELV